MTDTSLPAADTPPSPAPTGQVTVIIPAYNAARYLPRAVASALAQDNISTPQVVIVDDASTDDTAQVIADLSAAHPTVEGHANDRNMGPGGTRNHAISHATGDWIAILDADDAYLPGRLARLIATAEAEALDVIADLPVFWDLAAECAAPEQMPASGAVSRPGIVDFLRPDAETELDLGLLKPVFRRHLAEKGQWHYPEDIRHGEDSALYIALVHAGVSFGFLREAHYLFSTRIGAVSGQYSPGSVTDVDYLSLAAQSKALGAQLAAQGVVDADLDRVLETRYADMLRMNRIYGWTTLRKRDWPRFKRWLAQSPENRTALVKMVMAKLRGHRGLPD